MMGISNWVLLAPLNNGIYQRHLMLFDATSASLDWPKAVMDIGMLFGHDHESLPT